MAGVVWTCLGVPNELDCVFTTRYAAKADQHTKTTGHEVIQETIPSLYPLSKAQMGTLENEIRCTP